MPRNGSGTYNRVPGSAYTNGTVNDGSELDAEMNDIATALTASLTADGQKPLAANLPMAGYKLTGLGAGSAAADSANLGQVQAQAYSWLTSVSGTDTIVATATPVISAYSAGQTFRFSPANTNTGAVTINISGVGAAAVTKGGTTALTGGELVAGKVYEITHDGTRFQVSESFATDAETQAGSSRTISVTPASLAATTATTTRKGVIEIATSAETQTGADTERAVTPDALADTVIGMGQTWQSVARTSGVSYTNSTGRPIVVNCWLADGTATATLTFTVDGVTVGVARLWSQISNQSVGQPFMSIVVPNGSSYSFVAIGASANVAELR